MITDEYKIKVRYSEVDQMGYLYHANYVTLCHQARTELMRKFEIHDQALESKGIILPVIEMNLRYFKPAFYDEELLIITIIRQVPETKISFEFEIYNSKNEKICKALSILAIVNKLNRKPIRAPKFLKVIFEKEIEKFQYTN